MEIRRLTVITHFLAQTDKGVSRHKIWLLTANRIRLFFTITSFKPDFVQTTSFKPQLTHISICTRAEE